MQPYAEGPPGDPVPRAAPRRSRRRDHRSAPVIQDEGLKRALVPRQIAMMAIGSAIGVGLFLGSTVTIGLAGPGVIITYLAGAAIALVMGYALAEMAVTHPVAGSFGVFADLYLSPWFGFSV